MTQPPVVCPGGSQPNALAPLNNFLTGQALTRLFGLIFPETEFIELLALVAGYAIDTNTICASDPPAMPVWDGTTDFVFPPIFPFLSNSGFAKLGTMVQIAAWWTYCECKTGTTPPSPPAPVYPPGAPIVNPTNLPTPTSQPCYGASTSTHFPQFAVGVIPPLFPVLDLLPAGAPASASWQSTGYQSHLFRIPAGATSYAWTTTGTGTAPGPTLNLILWDNSLRLINNIAWEYTNGTPGRPIGPTTGPLPANATYWSIDGAPYGAGPGTQQGSAWDINQIFQVFCATQSTDGTANCCSDLLFRLQNILQLIENLQLGGPGGLFAYVDSTRHAALTGDGTITIQTKAVAFRVEVKSDLSTWPHHPQIPTYFFSLGFVTSYALQSPIKGWRLVYQSQTYPLAAECDQVGFQLPPGVTADIVELLATAG